jgi:5-methylcytosine-specific restriction protein A
MVKPPRLRSVHDHWYQRRRWRKRREYQLQKHPTCALCEQRGIISAAVDVDHVTPHGGNWYAFEYGPIQSLCRSCHASDNRTQERHGYSRTIGLNGLPIDKNHPCYLSDRDRLARRRDGENPQADDPFDGE